MNKPAQNPSQAPYTFRAEAAVDADLAKEVEMVVRNKVEALQGALQIPLDFGGLKLVEKQEISIPPEHVEEIRAYVEKTLGRKIHAQDVSIEVLPWNNTLLLQDNSPDTGNVWVRSNR